ncbi:MAG: EAL domain-containing protein [Sulfurovum sp.]|nr:EAL domain-containing protein [Sulfurovum sp.]
MHKLLKDQLKKSSIKKSDSCLKTKEFKKLITLIEETYEVNDALFFAETYQEKKNSSLLESIFNESIEGIIIQDTNNKVIRMNDAMQNIFNISKNNYLGKHLNFFSETLPAKVQKEINRALQTKGSWQGEVEVELNASQIIYVWLSFNTLRDRKNKIRNTIIRVNNMTKMYASKQKMKYIASYDKLTDIPNRALLFKHLKKSIASMQRTRSNGMLLFIDIDHFKEFNDNYGHPIGDKVLQFVAKRIQSISREEDIVGRLSGDEFLIIADNMNDQYGIYTMIHKILDCFKSPHQIGDYLLNISLSIGVALYPKDGDTPEILINAADQAMYSVKKSGRNNYAFYTQRMSDVANEYYSVHTALKDAINLQDFTLVYQPQFSVKNNSITGVEVLLRCTHASIKDVPIQRLINIAEETGIIHNISNIVLNMVCMQLYKWGMLGLTVPPIAINLSRKELHEKKLVYTIHNALTRYNLDPSHIELEITESAFLHENNDVQKNIQNLQKLGHTFSIDDYGTGFSSLSNIKTFSFDKLKIDKSFIDNLASEKEDQVIVSATITMAKKLGLQVIAEGVETIEQANLLKIFGCDVIQGYLYSRPLVPSAMEKLLLAQEV